MRHFFLFISTLTLIWGCQKSPTSYTETAPKEQVEVVADIDLPKIRERGFITAIIDNSSTGMFLYRGQLMGYEYELLRAMADSLDLELKLNITNSLEESFRRLNSGEGDVIAFNLTITKERKKRIAFTHYHNLVRLVLIQKKPDNWRDMKLHEIERELIRNPVELIGREVNVRNGSSYVDRLQNLSEEIGGDILIIEDFPDVETEMIIKKVADGEVALTVAEEDIALVNSTYYKNLDVKTPISFPQQIAWGVRKNSDSLLLEINKWILKMRKSSDYYVVYNRYFRNAKANIRRSRGEFSSVGGGKLSPYDDLIKQASEDIGWDWKLLAAQMYKESKFDPEIKSWAGAIGLMQVLPRTAKEYGITDLLDPPKNIEAGKKHIQWLQNFWKDKIPDEKERMKFILASYNVGQGHVSDAMRLAEKYGDDSKTWDTVAEWLLKKSIPKYYNDEVVEFGYCRGIEPVIYVRVILSTYDSYQKIFSGDSIGSIDLQS